MDAVGSYIITEILKSIGEGNVAKGLFLVAIFIVIWLEVRGLKKAVKNGFIDMGKKLAEGETRFENIEKNQKDFEHRLTMLEPKPQP